MRAFVWGLASGIILAVAAPAIAAELVDGDGPLLGWTVTKNGKQVCESPYVFAPTFEIVCPK